MQLTKLIQEQEIKEEYGLKGVRTFPWRGVVAPFGSGYCIVPPNTETYRHENEPADEEELFIGCQGNAIVLLDEQRIPIRSGDQIYIPRGARHSIKNESSVDEFHFFTIWWNSQCVNEYVASNKMMEPTWYE